jgi:dolichyl-phosphate-mannose-protein mannosyltransferase
MLPRIAISELLVMKHLPIALAVLLLLLMALLAGGAALRESITVDEVAHLGAGVSYLQKLDMRMNEEHPPLAKVIAALPLVLRGVHTDYTNVSWTTSRAWFSATLGEWAWGHYVALNWNDPHATVLWGRVPMLLLTLALGLAAYLLAFRLGNSWGGLLCLAAFVSTPAFLVFGPLILTDIAVTFFALLTLWSFASLWRAPDRRTQLSFGLLFGGALLTKFSAGLLLFCFLGFRLCLRYLPLAPLPTDRAELRQWRRLRGRYMWKGIFLAAIVVYAVYFILTWNQPTDSLQILGHGPASLLLRRLLMPPWIFLRGLALFAVTSRRATFLLGHNYSTGVWFYFPVLFVLKSTLAFLLMLAFAIVAALVARKKLRGIAIIPPEMTFHWRAVWTFLLVFVAASMLSPMTISIRHFTVPIVLLILLLAPVPRLLTLLRENGWPIARPAAAAYVVLALLSIATVIRAYPHYFPFVNSLSFGRPAYTLVNDSNLDWNQSLPEAREFAEAHGIQHVLLDEYGMIEPTVFVPQAKFWNCQLPAPTDAGQWAIVSASMIADGHNCLWLLNYPHTAFAGGSMYAFQLPNVIPRVGDPAGPPPPEAQRNFGGFPGPDTRLIFLKCIRDPNQLQPTMDEMRAQYEAEMARRKAQRMKH